MKTTIEQRLAELPPLTAGQHHSLDDGVCVMEAAAYLAGEPWTDHPECVCPTIGAFLRSWNDGLPDADRDRLIRPLIVRIIGSRSTLRAVEERRSWMALDWLIREHVPAWLALVPGMAQHAAKLRALVEVHDVETVGVAQPVVTAASDAARAAWVKARDSAKAASRDTASTAAMDAARTAASDAARDAASAVAMDAASAVAMDAASAAVWAATWAATRTAASAAASAAASDAASDAAAWYAANAAASAALAPTVATQQQSALRLIDRMLAVTEEGLA